MTVWTEAGAFQGLTGKALFTIGILIGFFTFPLMQWLVANY